ncbi:MAG: c-type cytochrome [Alphaproteobacteria bacterium]
MTFNLGLAGAVALAALAAASGAAAETPLERGTYLMKSIVACGNCHTPQGPNGPLPNMELAGGLVFDEAPAFVAVAPNITPDVQTGIGGWTDAQIIASIREGKRPDGTIIGPPMPIGLYRGLSDGDVKAIVAYLRAAKPVKNTAKKSQYNVPLPPAYGPPVGSVPEPDRKDKVKYGAYLAGPAGHCIECHSTPGPQGAPDIAGSLGAGGMQFRGPWGVSVASNITPTGIGKWTDAQVKTAITKGLRPDGSKLLPPMGIPYYANIAPTDLDAIVAYLRTLPPK